jgi:hypothetical protein
MSLLKNSVAGNHSSPGWDKSRHVFRPERKADRVNRSGVKPDGTKMNPPAFAEDFMLEHSRSGLSLTLIVVPGTFGAASQESQQSSECFGFPS